MRGSGRLILPAVLLVWFVAAAGERGGWATITVEELPNHMVAGEPVQLAFTLRQHGRTPLVGRSPAVEVEAPGVTLRAPARAQPQTPGRYNASFTVPRAGDATITIDGDFGPARVTLLPLRSIRPGTAPPVLSAPEVGKRLFVAKGCVSCHRHADVQHSSITNVGPELTERRYTTDYLKRLLRDPQATITTERAFDMPNLGLKPHEIAALTAFINAERADR